jgi:hypothetical protein
MDLVPNQDAKGEKMIMVRIKHWIQDTETYGYWTLSGLIAERSAKELIASGWLIDPKIVTDSEFEYKEEELKK